MGITSFTNFLLLVRIVACELIIEVQKIPLELPSIFFKKKKLELLSSLVYSIHLVRRNELMDLILKSKVSW